MSFLQGSLLRKDIKQRQESIHVSFTSDLAQKIFTTDLTQDLGRMYFTGFSSGVSCRV